MKIIAELLNSFGEQPDDTPPVVQRPISARIPFHHIALTDAMAAHLGKSRSGLLGSLLPDALENALLAMPKHYALKLSADATVAYLKMLIEESTDPYEVDGLRHEIDLWHAYQEYDPDDSHPVFVERPKGLFDHLINNAPKL